MQFSFDLGEDFAVLEGLFAGEFAVLTADGEVVLVFGFGGLQIGFYSCYGGVKVLLGEFAFPDGDDGPGEGVEALGEPFYEKRTVVGTLRPFCSSSKTRRPVFQYISTRLK